MLRKDTATDMGIDIEELDVELDRLADSAASLMKDMRSIFEKWLQRRDRDIEFRDLYFSVSIYEVEKGLAFDAKGAPDSVQSYLKAYEKKDPEGLAKLLVPAFEAGKIYDKVRGVEYETSLRWNSRKQMA